MQSGLSERLGTQGGSNSGAVTTPPRTSVLSESELVTLYSATSVSDYQPKLVHCQSIDGTTIEALTYILPSDYTLPPPEDDSYTRSLVSICKKLKLPPSYVANIEKKFIKT